MSPKSRLVGAVILLGCIAIAKRTTSTRPVAEHPEVCAGPRLGSAEARQQAFEKGYDVDRHFDCVTRASAAMIAMEDSAAGSRKAGADSARTAPAQTLAEARRGFTTTVSQPLAHHALPTPPAHLFVRSDYTNAGGLPLAAFVTPDPKDGRKHPAIIWLTGGDSNTLDDFWTPGSPAHDESASAFRDAGMVMMYPTLRGGNENGGAHEYFYGEVDDVLAAADRLARLPYVDADRIYLGGHSTGGTLVLLAAEMSGRFKAVFAFGPVAEVDRYPETLIPVAFRTLDKRERTLRSPLNWLGGITSPTWLIEGRVSPSNSYEVEQMCRANHNPMVHCIMADGVDHFAVLGRVTPVIAARLSIAGDVPFQLAASEFSR